jgi:uncharacterized metal-binding protein
MLSVAEGQARVASNRYRTFAWSKRARDDEYLCAQNESRRFRPLLRRAGCAVLVVSLDGCPIVTSSARCCYGNGSLDAA